MILQILEQAKNYVTDKLKTGSWHFRNIGWLNVNIEENPKQRIDNYGPYQFIFSNEISLKKNLYWHPGVDLKEEVEDFALTVREYTGEWIHFIECDKIFSEDRYNYNEVVFFGDEEDLEYNKLASSLITV